MKKVLNLILILLSIIMLSSCGYNEVDGQYYDNKRFSIDEYYNSDIYIKTLVLDINTQDDYIIDYSNSYIFSDYTDVYDRGIITKIMDGIEFMSIYELDYKYSYIWYNINNYEIEVQYVGYNGNNRLYNVVMFVNNVYVDSFFFEKENNYWYIN